MLSNAPSRLCGQLKWVRVLRGKGSVLVHVHINEDEIENLQGQSRDSKAGGDANFQKVMPASVMRSAHPSMYV